MAKLWAGRFGKETDLEVNDFNSSISFDCRLYKEDITGSMAHAAMLGKQGIIEEHEAEKIVEGLKGILKDIEEGNVPSSTRLLFSYDEDCPESYGSLFLAFYNNPYDASDGSYSLYQETAPRESASIDLFLTMANTIAAMENMGFQFAK